MKTIKLSNKILVFLIFYLPATVLLARVTTVKYICDENKTLTVSYFSGESTDNATSTFDGWAHKMYLDESISDQMVSVYKEEPYILHLQNTDDFRNARLITITKEIRETEDENEKPVYELLYKQCVPTGR